MRRTAIVLAVILFASSASAETFLRFTNKTEGAPGAATPATESTVWLSAQALRRDQGQASTLVRLDQKKLFVLNHTAKTYTEISLPVDLRAAVPEAQRATLDQLAQSMQVTATVKPTEERKTLGKDWKTRRYDVALSNKMGLAVDAVVWAGPVPGVDLGQFKTLTRHLASLMPGDSKWVDELMKIEGVPVLREVTFRGSSSKSREELVSAETKTAPAGTFEVPAGYRKVELNPLTAIGGF